MPEEKQQAKETNDILTKVVERIENASNILVAVSKNPTADELSAALGLTMMLDGIGKHATAIYSGKTPEMLKFLEPDKTFENNTNSLQDFIIALNKDKADHLRYKVDGEYVKVFITPYKTTIDEGDLEFSHGDYNVDLVIALGVQTTDDLDGALYEHSRIMHDASSINITDKEPGKFAEIEWNDPSRSSVSEMVSDLAYAMRDKVKMTKPVATALLTGIIAETDRFSNDDTTPRTMDVAAKLMQAGANQKQISENIEKAVEAAEEKEENELEVTKDDEAADLDKLADEAAGKSDEGELDVQAEKPESEPESMGSDADGDFESTGPANDGDSELTPEEQLDQLVNQPKASALEELQKAANEIYPNPQDDTVGMNRGETIEEPAEMAQPKDYGQMMEEALAEPLPNPAAQATPAAPTGPELNHIPDMEYMPHAQTTPVTVPEMGENYLTTSTAEQPQPPMVEPQMAEMPAPEMPAATPEAPVMAPEMSAAPEAPAVAPMAPVEPAMSAVPVPPAMPEIPVPPMPPVAPVVPVEPVVPAPNPAPVPTADPTAQFVAEPQAFDAPATQPDLTAVPSPVAQPDLAAPAPVAPAPVAPTMQPDLTASQLEQANDPGAFKIPGM